MTQNIWKILYKEQFRISNHIKKNNTMQKLIFKLIGLLLNLGYLILPKQFEKKAYELFGRPSKPKFRLKEQEFVASAVQINSEFEGIPCVEYHWGPADGPILLLSYGWDYNAGRWRHFVPALVAAGHHVIAYDPPGHGRNTKAKPFVTAVINSKVQRGLIVKYGRPTAVIAHSFGGACMVYTLKNLPAQLRPLRMVLMASFSSVPRIFEEYRRATGLWPSLYYGMIRRLEKQLGAPLDSFDMARMSSELHAIQALIVHDPSDKVTPFVNAQRYHDYWPGSMLLAANGTGHHLGKEAITAQILEFSLTGKMPERASINNKPLAANHDLIRYFAGMEGV
jgi:pimeloyl-ACP methyl ester carboxylesterase